jgi:ABC-type Fe3+/spermidine/putrescine transport system ATPase subunit
VEQGSIERLRSNNVGDGRIALEVNGLVKRYNEDGVIGPIDLAIRDGEFFSLLGPSGCGKSTTLRCIAGFETPTAGAILLNGERLDTKPAHKRGLGLVFQSHALFPHLTVADNVAFGLVLRKVDETEIARRVGRMLELVGLSGLDQRMPSQLSGGQQQRVALARSLVLEPPLLLLDEPLSSLDLKLRQQMRSELRSLQRELGQTTIFVTHDQTEALAMSDRIAVLCNGRVVQVGTPNEIYNLPATRFVADFIGESNTLAAIVEAVGERDIQLRLESGATLKARRPVGSGLTVGEAVWAVVRPENLNLDPSSQPALDGETVLDGTLESVSYLGEDLHARFRVPRLGTLIATMKSTRQAAARVGACARIGLSSEDVVVIVR